MNPGNPQTEDCENRFSNEDLNSSFKTADSGNYCRQKSAVKNTDAELCLEELSLQQIFPELILNRYHKFIKNIVRSVLEV